MEPSQTITRCAIPSGHKRDPRKKLIQGLKERRKQTKKRMRFLL